MQKKEKHTHTHYAGYVRVSAFQTRWADEPRRQGPEKIDHLAGLQA